ncbi:MAG: glycolate oxidase subunit GlcF [Proteobacteria bacterium]|nr:glycolate oxidase subunit GlcF [Pseudomonadota bacterium]
MQTLFSEAQLADPHTAEANRILRKCVHCGFCIATCPTYVLLGDELDSPRGRIYMIKDMLENDKPASAKVTKHIDRCLSCFSCMTTCPSGVDYMHLVDQARARIEDTFRRPLPERMFREMLARVLPSPTLMRLALFGARLAEPLKGYLTKSLRNMMDLAPRSIPAPSPVDRPQVFRALGDRRMRVALMTGCAQQVLRPAINEATVRLLTRHGCEVVVAKGAGCCGALVHHMGRKRQSLAAARANVAAWQRVADLDAVVINASGCGTTVKDYGVMLAGDRDWAAPAAHIAGITRDVTEVMAELGLKETVPVDAPVIAYHAACSLQHGQRIIDQPKALLADAGFELREPAEGHLCCGSAGTYNILQPVLAARLRDRKAANLEKTGAGAIATGNIGCLVQISQAVDLPVVHTVELLDWATGGPRPEGL